MTKRISNLNDHGVTLVELMVVFGIIAILVVAGAFQYQGWIGRYRVEGEVKQMYTDLMNARALALSRGKMHFINMPAADSKRYRVFEDSDPPPEGNQLLTTDDENVIDGETTYTLSPSKRHLEIDKKGMITNGTGLVQSTEYVRFVTDSSLDPDYDCIGLTATRVNMGIWNGTSCAEK